MENDFIPLQIMDNFYQTSSFFPMPLVLICTLNKTGHTNIGPYSLCFPYNIAGRHLMLLTSRHDSNTSVNIRESGLCTINFIPDKMKYLKNCVELGYPGETTEEKMKNSIFTTIPSMREDNEKKKGLSYPDIVKEADQVFECSHDPSFPVKLHPDAEECHFILNVDKIILKKKWHNALVRGKGFPRMPVDYGFRNNAYFWISAFRNPKRLAIPESKGINVQAVKFAADRTDPSVKWEDAAYAKLVKIPRVFLGKALSGILDIAKKEGITVITPAFLDRIRDKRYKEKKTK